MRWREASGRASVARLQSRTRRNARFFAGRGFAGIFLNQFAEGRARGL